MNINIDPHPCDKKCPVERLTQENHELKLKIITLESNLNSLKSKSNADLQTMEISYKQQISDLEHRLDIANSQISALNEQIRKNQCSLTQTQSINKFDYQEKIDSYNAQIQKLNNDILNQQKQSEQDKSYYKSKITAASAELSQLYTILSSYFCSDIQDLKTLNESMVNFKAKPVEIDNSAELLEKIQNLQNKNKDLKNLLRNQLNKYEELQKNFQSYHSEMEQFKNSAQTRDSSYKAEIDQLNERIDVLTHKIQKSSQSSTSSSPSKEYSEVIQKVQEPVTIIEPQRPPAVASPMDDEIQEQLLQKIKKLNCKLIKKNKDIQVLADVLRNNELKLQDYEAKLETNQLEYQHLEKRLEESESKLSESNERIAQLKVLKSNCEISDVIARKMHRQKLVIADQLEEIKRLETNNNKLSDNIKSLNVTIQRLETELSIAKSTIENNKTLNMTEIKNESSPNTSIQIEWELCDGIPYELQSRIREISNQDSLSLSSKIKMIIESLTKYFNGKIDLTSTAKQDLQRAMKRIEYSLQPFVEEIIYTLTGRKLSFDAIVESPEIQSSAIKTAASKMRSPAEIEGLRNQLNSARTEVQELKRKVEKNKQQKSIVYDTESSAESLRLMKENSELKKLVEEQREAANSKIRDAKFTIINEYESVIAKLKERCEKQKKTIQDLMDQLSSIGS